MQQKIIIGFVLTLIIVIFIPVYWAMEPGRQEAAQERQQAEAVERGAEIYSSSCTLCHGLAGEGGAGPALKGTTLNEDALKKIIIRGVAGTIMPALGQEDGGPLKEHQIEDLITFIKNWDSAPTTIPAPVSPTTPPAVAADELYAIRCAGCHGANREGVSDFAPALTPESLAALSDAEIRDTILNGRSGTAMIAFKSALSPEEIEGLLQLIKYTSP